MARRHTRLEDYLTPSNVFQAVEFVLGQINKNATLQ